MTTPSILAYARRRLMVGGIWMIAGTGVVLVLGVATSAMLTRLLAPAAVGGFFLAGSITVFGALVATGGVDIAAVRFIAERRAREDDAGAARVLARCATLVFAGACAVGAIYALAGDVIAEHVLASPALAGGTMYVAAWLAIGGMQRGAAAMFRGLNELHANTLVDSVIHSALFTAGIAIVFASGVPLDLGSAFALAVGTRAVSLALAIVLLWVRFSRLRRSGRGTETPAPALLPVAAPALITAVVVWLLGNFDLWLVAATRPAEEVAIYGATLRLARVTRVPLDAIGPVIQPLVAELHAKGKPRELERVLRSSATVTLVPVVLALAVFVVAGESLMSALFGDLFAAGGTVLAVLAVGDAVNTGAGSCGQVLLMTGHQRAMMMVTIASAIVSITAAVLLVDRWGMLGVAVAVSGGKLIMKTALLALVRARFGIWSHAGLGWLRE